MFARNFPVDALAGWDAAHPGNAVRRLFDYWVLPGMQGAQGAALRVAIRDGYLNFYAKGQSVAKLSFGAHGPRIQLHRSYLDGLRRAKAAEHRSNTSRSFYVSLSPIELARADTAERVMGWIESAESYASAEKRFVDELVGCNAGVIDLEMGLPADIVDEERSAPRMDLVLAQRSPANITQIAFWEAKCSTNSELRAEENYSERANGNYGSGPKVVHQLRKYQKWLSQRRIVEVQAAYHHSARILLALAAVFGKAEAPCFAIWRDLEGTKAPEVVLPPGVVIGNYCPEGHKGADRFAQRALTFEPHRRKLSGHGITICEVAQSRELPRLNAGGVLV
jgi:hypothetical protein